MKKFILLLMIAYSNVNGQSEEILIQNGIALIESKPDSAIALFNQAIQLNPENYLSWYYIAYCYGSIGNYDETINFSMKALNIKDDDSRSLTLLGISQILTGSKLIGCKNLDKSITLDNSDKDTNDIFNQLCGRYYMYTFYTELGDSTIIDKINKHITENWSLNAIGEGDGYLQFVLLSNEYLNYKENESFNIEWGIYIFDRVLDDNLIKVKNDYKSISSIVDYKVYHIKGKELIIAMSDGYVKLEELDAYYDQRKRIIADLKNFGATL